MIALQYSWLRQESDATFDPSQSRRTKSTVNDAYKVDC